MSNNNRLGQTRHNRIRKFPKVSRGVAGVCLAVAGYTAGYVAGGDVEKPVETVAVGESASGALKDEAFLACLDVDIPTKDRIGEAREVANKIGDEQLGSVTRECINGRLAAHAAKPNFDKFESLDKVVAHNGYEYDRQMEIVNAIEDAKLKETAQRSLDLATAKAAIDYFENGNDDDDPENKVSMELLKLVSDKGIYGLALDVMAGREGAKEEFNDLYKKAYDDAVYSDAAFTRNDLYDGSNSQAKVLRSMLDSFDKARVAGGQ